MTKEFSLSVLCMSMVILVLGQDRDDISFMKRGNRYEGIYDENKPPQSNMVRLDEDAIISISSFTVGKFNFVKDASETIILVNPPGRQIIARSTPVSLSFRYRLESMATLEELVWPVKDVLIHLENLDATKIGIFAYNNRGNGIYSPVDASHITSIKNDTTVRVFLSISRNMKKISWRLLDCNNYIPGFTVLKPMEDVKKEKGVPFIRPGSVNPIFLPDLRTLPACFYLEVTFWPDGKPQDHEDFRIENYLK